ncbi:MAG: hypothetical protein JW811_01490 [Clostridiales bacterium]|nr:hypothetical protein [Clostridiales bacterium]
MKKHTKIIALLTALVLLLAAGGVSAAAEGAGQTVNILLLACESGYPISPLIVSLDFEQKTVKVVNFYYQTQINAVTKKGESLSMPMNFLLYCDTEEIVKAYENTFGIPIDRYVIFSYTYGNFQPAIQGFDMLTPVIVDIPEELLGNEQYTTINGNMKPLAGVLNREYTLITQAGPNALDAVGIVSYIGAIPDWVWSSGDRFTMMMEDYKYWDAKYRALIEGLRPNIAAFDHDAALAFWQRMVADQATDITGDDIALWSQTLCNFPEDAPYLTIPGFEGVTMQDFDANALTGVYGYDAKMFAYDGDAISAIIRAFIAGE